MSVSGISGNENVQREQAVRQREEARELREQERKEAREAEASREAQRSEARREEGVGERVNTAA